MSDATTTPATDAPAKKKRKAAKPKSAKPAKRKKPSPKKAAKKKPEANGVGPGRKAREMDKKTASSAAGQLGAEIKKRRTAAGRSVEDVAGKSGVGRATIYDLEAGAIPSPMLSTIAGIDKALGQHGEILKFAGRLDW